MEKSYIIALIVAIVVGVALYFIRKAVIKKYTMKLMRAILTDEDDFLKLIDSFVVKYLFDAYNREYMRLSYYIAKGADKKVKEQISLMDQMRMSRNQRLAAYQRAFQYFISIDNETNAKNMQRKINAFVDENNMDPSIKKDIEMDMKMYFNKDISTIPYIDEKLKDANDEDKAVWNLRKAYILKANHKLDEAMECMKIVVDCTTDPSQKQIMQDLIDHNLKDL